MNIAFAGFRHGHIWALYDRASGMEGVRVVGAWEADEEARAAAQEKVREPFYDSYEALLKDPAVDTVAVADYFAARGDLIIRALRAGKHVIADKPICTSRQELETIRELSLEKQLKLVCMLDLRYDGAVRAAKRMIGEGRLGRIHAMGFTGQHPLSYGTRPGWYFEEGKHGGTINDIAIHGIDAIRYMTGLEFVRATAARTWNAYADQVPFFNDCAQFMAEFEGGAGLVADVSYAGQTRTAWSLPSYWRFTIWGTDGSVEFKCGENRLIFAGKDSEQVEEIACDPVAENWLTDLLKPYDAEAVRYTLDSTEATLIIQEAADKAF